MKKTTSRKSRMQAFALLTTLFFSSLTFSQTTFHTATFESSLDGWTRVSNAYWIANATYAAEGNNSIMIRRSAGQLLSPSFALDAYDKVDLTFYFTNRGYDTGETLTIEYRPDTSSSWVQVASFVAGNVPDKTADFQFGTPFIDYAKTITLFKADHTFPVSATGQFRFLSNASSNFDRVYIDNISLTGTTFDTSISEGPGGVTSNLELWLRADKVDGTGTITDNTGVTSWQDVGKGNDANTLESYQAPTYKNNSTDNVNFNPVVDFNNNNNLSVSDMDYLDDKDEMAGTAGFYSHDIFVVVTPDQTITTSMIPLDTFTSADPTGQTFEEDVTGFGYGSYTQRFTDEYFAYCIGTTTGEGVGYGKGDLDFTIDLNQVGIINARHNDITTPTGQNVYFNNIAIAESESDAPDFAAVSNTRYWLGRSQYWNGSFGGRIMEVITYSATNADGTASDNRNRIQSYLAVKYGITLGVNGTSQDYVDASGTVIWDQSADAAAFNYDIAGIGRSDAAGLMQRQSKSINTDTMITMGITEIATTNDANANNIPIDESYLMWANDNGSLAAAPNISVDMSAGISGLSTMVDFTSISRTWKVVETGGDVPTVSISIPEVSLSATITPPGSYLMFISDTPSFSPTSEYRVMSVNGANLETSYDFNGTKYITFGYAPQYFYERSITFDGTQDYLDADDIADLTGAFSISAWVKRDSSVGDRDIVSKRNSAFSTGYALRIDGSGRPQMQWIDGSLSPQTLTAGVALPLEKWHHISATFDGTTATLYIDGVQAAQTNLNPPVANSEHLLIAAADYLSPSNLWEGSIDEVRIWSAALSVDQLRYVMNQELQEHTDNTVDGQTIPQSITLNEVSSLDWPDLVVYYPMNFYTFTNVNDSSGNNNVAAIRNLDTVDFQSAPLPYISAIDGDWSVESTWSYGSLQNLPGAKSIIDGSTDIDWNIVQIQHEIDNPANTTLLAAIIDGSGILNLSGNNKLEVSHYLNLDGKLDLQGESQLVQTTGSDLERTSAGFIEKDQGGTADVYTYNYWSAPVSKRQPYSLNRTYNLNNILNDGSDPMNPTPVNWVGGYNGSAGSPISISEFWIFKYDNHPIGDYSSWQYLGAYGFLEPGQGYTMKGPGTGGVGDEQNYTFIGKPNNDQASAQIELNIDEDNNYLVGNPFPSALDANDFILDNEDLDGTLYFWEHWGGGSHTLDEYQGGYAMYNLSGGTLAVSHPDVSGTGTGSIIPQRYVPVGQGFFVAADSDGTIEFNNSQRNFVLEGSSSVFTFTDDGFTAIDDSSEESPATPADDTAYDQPDLRTKLRIGFDSPKGYHRQLLLTFDDNTTLGRDRGYDGKVFYDQTEDMNFIIEEQLFVIQGIPVASSDVSTTLPLSIRIAEHGDIRIGLDAFENPSEKLVPYLHDKAQGLFVDLREDYYTTLLEPGIYDDRFEIVLRKTERQQDQTTTGKSVNTVAAMHSKTAQQVTVFSKEEATTISAVAVFNILGQQVGTFQFSGNTSTVSFDSTSFSTGTYILQIQTENDLQTTKIIIDK